MKRARPAARPLLKLSVATSPEAEEAVAALLEKNFSQPASIHLDVRTGATTVSVFLDHGTECPVSRREQLRAGLRLLASAGLAVGPGKVFMQKLRRENWAESWKRHFPPLEIASTLLVKPVWSKRRARKNQAVVLLNPGLSFGTGQHPTTRFCLEQLVCWRERERRQSFLDIGTGSGILAIAAAKLGYSPVKAFDFDSEAIRIARRNAHRNRVSDKLHLSCCDLVALSPNPVRRYDVICANLTFDLLLAQKYRILPRLKTSGVLILAGILRSQFPLVAKEYKDSGLKLVRTQASKEWRSGAFCVQMG